MVAAVASQFGGIEQVSFEGGKKYMFRAIVFLMVGQRSLPGEGGCRQQN